MSEAEHLEEREHLKAWKIRPTGASRTSATQAGKPFVHCSLFFMCCTCRQPPSHYFEQLDTYLHSGRDLDLELEGGRPGSSGQLEKKAKGSSRREEGGLLPPLLALAPQVVSQTTCAIVPPISPISQERPPSPGHALKMDSYLCPGQDHLTAPYLPDGTIDYTNMDY